MCVADGKGVRGRDEVRLPPIVAERLHRVSASQELTVEAAVTGDRDEGVRGDARSTRSPGASTTTALGAMTDEMLAATKAWLPQFAWV